MIMPDEIRYIERIAQRAAALYEQMDMKVRAPFIADEIEFVHRNIVPLRLKEFAEADNSNFAHDIGGIHRHINMPENKFDDCFMPRFADVQALVEQGAGHS